MLSVLPRQTMTDAVPYTTQLQAGLGLVQETTTLLEYWQPGMETMDLYQGALQSGAFPNISARRLRNIVAECFAPRFLRGEGPPARYLKCLKPALSSTELNQFYFLYTCRANQILGDFVRAVYWDRYESGANIVGKDDATEFIERAIDDGKTSKRWSESTVKRLSPYDATEFIERAIDDGKTSKRWSESTVKRLAIPAWGVLRLWVAWHGVAAMSANHADSHRAQGQHLHRLRSAFRRQKRQQSPVARGLGLVRSGARRCSRRIEAHCIARPAHRSVSRLDHADQLEMAQHAGGCRCPR